MSIIPMIFRIGRNRLILEFKIWKGAREGIIVGVIRRSHIGRGVMLVESGMEDISNFLETC